MGLGSGLQKGFGCHIERVMGERGEGSRRDYLSPGTVQTDALVQGLNQHKVHHALGACSRLIYEPRTTLRAVGDLIFD